MPATVPHRPHALALGLILPLAFAGAASAQQQNAAPVAGWVDPPSRASAPAPGAAQAGKDRTGEAVRDMAGTQPPREPAKADVGRTGETAPGRQAVKREPAEEAPPTAARVRIQNPRRAAPPDRPSGREAQRRRAHPAYPFAAMPAGVDPDPAVSAERAAAARALTADYLATVSGPGDAMVGAASRFYATRVRFYGRPITTAGLVAEKRSFVQRWPERRYEPRAIRAACDPESCTIRALVAFRTANPGRGAVSSGEAELILDVGFAGTRPYIVGETGRVLRRSLQAGTLAPTPGKA